MRIGLDIMGGDNAPQATLEGAYLATKALDNKAKIVLFGDKEFALNWFSENNIDIGNIDIFQMNILICIRALIG